MCDLVLLKIPQSLGDDVSEVYLGLVAEGVSIFGGVVSERGKGNVVAHQLVLTICVPFNIDVVFGEKHGHSVLDFCQDKFLVPDPALSGAFFFSLHDHQFLVGGGMNVHEIWIAIVRPHVPIFHLGAEDIGEVACMDLPHLSLLGSSAQSHIVKHKVVLVRVFGSLHAGR